MEKRNFEIKETALGFKFISIKHDRHDHKELKMWINNKIHITPTEEEDKYILEFPVEKAQIFKTEKGSFVLKPDKGNVFYHSVKSGYRGSSNLEVEKDCELITKVWEFASQTGSLGDTTHAFFNSKLNKIEIRWFRSGRRVDQTEGVVRLTLGGSVEELIDDSEVCEMLD